MKSNNSLLSVSLIMLVLSLLSEGDKYGYEIIQILEERSDKSFELKEGTLYPILHKLEKEKEVVSYEVKTEHGRKRKYYQITTKGKKRLASKVEEWNVFQMKVAKVLTFA